MASWSGLHYDVLGHITSFLPLADHHRFSAVCQNWRWVVKQNHCSPAVQLPWLVMRQEAYGTARKFFNLSENREYYIDIPELYEQQCCGSSYGWLFIVDDKFEARLLNPFTREVIELPELSKLGENMHYKRNLKVILSDDPSVKSNFTIVFLYYRSMQAIFWHWRPGDLVWTNIRYMSKTIQDAVFMQGTLYVLYMKDSIYAVELGSVPTARLAGPKYPPINGIYHLVDFMGKLLLVHRRRKRIKEKQFTYSFDIQKVDLNEKKYYPCTDLGNYAIFLGSSSPVVVDSKQFQRCKSNSIYFTDYFESLSSPEYGCHDLGVYDIKKGTVEPYYPPEIFQPLNEPPIWLTPNCRKSTVFKPGPDRVVQLEKTGPSLLCGLVCWWDRLCYWIGKDRLYYWIGKNQSDRVVFKQKKKGTRILKNPAKCKDTFSLETTPIQSSAREKG